MDAGILTALVSAAGLDLYVSRLLSFSIAVTVTWKMNRTLAFSSRKNGAGAVAEYGRYVVVQVLGALLNLAAFALLLMQSPFFKLYPIVPLAGASLVSMVFTYTGARLWVFRAATRPAS